MSENPNIEKSKTVTYSEGILMELRRLADSDDINLFDAFIAYAEEIDVEIEEITEHLDAGAMAILRQAAMEANRVRKCVGIQASALEFE